LPLHAEQTRTRCASHNPRYMPNNPQEAHAIYASAVMGVKRRPKIALASPRPSPLPRPRLQPRPIRLLRPVTSTARKVPYRLLARPKLPPRFRDAFRGTYRASPPVRRTEKRTFGITSESFEAGFRPRRAIDPRKRAARVVWASDRSGPVGPNRVLDGDDVRLGLGHRHLLNDQASLCTTPGPTSRPG
jgi:hypothetical protein